MPSKHFTPVHYTRPKEFILKLQMLQFHMENLSTFLHQCLILVAVMTLVSTMESRHFHNVLCCIIDVVSLCISSVGVQHALGSQSTQTMLGALQTVRVQHVLGSLSTQTMLGTLQAVGAQQALGSLSTQSLLLLPLNHHQSLRTHLN